MKCDFPLDNPPGLYLDRRGETYTVTAYLQVGARTFRHFEESFPGFDSAAIFMKEWTENWKLVAATTWDYHGLEDIVELDLDTSPLKAVMAKLVPATKPLVRRL